MYGIVHVWDALIGKIGWILASAVSTIPTYSQTFVHLSSSVLDLAALAEVEPDQQQLENLLEHFEENFEIQCDARLSSKKYDTMMHRVNPSLIIALLDHTLISCMIN